MQIKAAHSRVKLLMPSMREKSRYVAFEIITQNNRKIGFSEFSRSFSQRFMELAGEIEYAKANPYLMPDNFDEQLQRGIIRIERSYVELLKAALCTMKSIQTNGSSVPYGNNIIVKSIITSGSIRKAKERIKEKIKKREEVK